MTGLAEGEYKANSRKLGKAFVRYQSLSKEGGVTLVSQPQLRAFDFVLCMSARQYMQN